MKGFALHLALVLALSGSGEAQAQDSSSAIRRDHGSARTDGLSDDESMDLAQRGLRLGADAASTADFLNALSAVAALCADSSPSVAREIRASSLALLTRSFHDSRRWSTLLVEGFLPSFDRLPRTAWSNELEHYEAIFDELADHAHDRQAVDRLRAELAWARAYVFVHLDREPEGLTAAQRQVAIERLEQLTSTYGGLPIPGSRDADSLTVGDRARAALEEMQSLAFGKLAPATAGVDLEGNAIDLAESRGRVVVLDFWTSFCTPCLAMVPHTRALLARLEGEPVSFFGVCGDETQHKGRTTAERVGMQWPSLWDGPSGASGVLAAAWHVKSWPMVYVLDAEGRIRFKFRSREEAESGLESAIRSLLAELQ